ncbi:PREDICTED: uncharacterized protein LOC106748608 [Dinoponera quadriceps]|uniref:Odorant receptor n=1 Tax=Dinoponera quadriceps TaxID=609295 RepID=A0A6P3XW79_DINQU|nr:PREDICTED: uncharacterized protein LOC106748608 [Dinoponera quadriceps]
MHATEASYYKINRVILKTLGLWPYQQSRLVRIQNVLFIVILTSFIIVQLMVFVTTQYNTNVLFEVLSLMFPNVFVTLKYYLYVIQANVKQLLERIHDDWGSLKDKVEIKILKKYTRSGRFITIIVMLFCNIFAIFSIICQFLPMILDIVSPLNASRPYQIVARTEYFVSQEKYFYAIATHEIVACYIGMVAICSYRIEIAIERNALTIPAPRRDYLLHRRVVHAVTFHQRANELFVQLITLIHDTNEMIVFALIVAAHLSYIFLINYGGQEITEHGIKLFRTTYTVPWYTAPLQTQKLLLMIMQRGTRNVILTCGGMFVASLELFVSVKCKVLVYRKYHIST